MDGIINPVSGPGQSYTPPVAKPTTDSAPTVTPQVAQPAPVVTEAPAAPSSNSGAYEAAVRQAALSFKDVYAVSDQSFTIFKDSTGKYITRYVSLRDGKVTYVPEPTLVKHVQPRGGNIPLHIAINV